MSRKVACHDVHALNSTATSVSILVQEAATGKHFSWPQLRLKLAFMQLNSDNILNRFSLLHICIHVFQLDLARLVQVMRPMDTLLSLTQNIPDDPFAAVTSPSPTASFLKSIQESGIVLGQPGDTSSYVLKILFSALLGTMFGDDPEGSAVQKNLCLWYTVYHDVVSM